MLACFICLGLALIFIAIAQKPGISTGSALGGLFCACFFGFVGLASLFHRPKPISKKLQIEEDSIENSKGVRLIELKNIEKENKGTLLLEKVELDKFIEVDEATGTKVYIIKQVTETKTFIKVGLSNNVEQRVATIQTANPYKIELLQIFHFKTREEAFIAEQSIHRYLKEQKLHILGEWFITPDEKTLNDIKEIIKAIKD